MPNEVPFGRYALLTKIASGGMAELFLARQRGPEGFEKLVAIKRILPERSGDAHFVELFLEEARLAARLSHPNIAQIYDLGIEGDSYFLAMEYVSGENLGTLDARAREQGFRVPLPLIVKIAIDVCEGLYYAHHLTDPLGRPLRVVHCDISPQNVLIGYDGSVKIVDFGIARAAADTRRQAAEVRGKAAYMSPEQVLGQPLDHSSDLFSLGIILYELLAQRRLFARDELAATTHAVREEPIPSLRRFTPEIPPGLEAGVMRSLERNRERRYPDARALQRDLESVLADRGGVPSNAALSEFMSLLFKETLEKRIFVESTMTAVIPMTGTQVRAAPTVVEAPPPAERTGGPGPWSAAGTTQVAAPRAGAMGILGVALGLVVGVMATVWYSRSHTVRPAAIAQDQGAQPSFVMTPVQPPEVMELGPIPDGASPKGPQAPSTPETGVERRLDPMAIRHARVQRSVKFGYVAINTEPWSNVRIGGRLLGATPVREVKLPVGRHKFTFENASLKLRVTVPVDVQEGKHVQHRFMLQRAGSGWTVARHLQL
ncbi:MAG TPA: protein kinase [Polyangia bacterium]|nr:protein kinase [Polyangia bacterium]